MSRRQHDDEIELGSDSFLDIIANIVGILIILIVIAGVKVGRQPLDTEVVEPAPTEVGQDEILAPSLPAFEPEPEEVADLEPEPDPEPTIEEPIKPRFPMPVAPSRFVAAPQDKTQPRAVFDGSFAQKESNLDRYAERKQIMNTEITRLASLRRQASSTLDKKMDANAKSQAKLASLRKEIEADRAEAAALRRRLALAEQQKVDVHQIEHKVTPVGRDVVGTEVHFRIADGKVSYVPVDELVNELKTDAARKQNALMRSSTYQGKVGPIKGYRMSYKIARKRATMGDDLRYGGSMFRVVVSEWEVEPTPGLEQETLTQAMRSGSLFDRRLLMQPNDANVTLWVYPDSFDEYRALQQRVHREGLTVAGRPLPFGVSIAGSPNGTKSSGQ